MSRGFMLKNNFSKETLIELARIKLITVSEILSPYFLHEISTGHFKDKIKWLIRKRAKTLRELQKRKLIEFKEMPDNLIKITLSQFGKNLIRQYKLEDIKIKKPKNWDRKWRIIIYDIPNNKKAASLALSRKMRSLGLYQLQKSVWVSPYDCLPELEFLCAIFDINFDDCICYFTTTDLPKEKEIKKFFNL